MKHHQKRGESSRDGGGTSYTAEDDNELAELFSKASLNKRNRIEDEPAVYGEAEDEIDATTWGANKRMSRKGNSRNSRQSWRKGTRIRETEGPTEPLDPSMLLTRNMSSARRLIMLQAIKSNPIQRSFSSAERFLHVYGQSLRDRQPRLALC